MNILFPITLFISWLFYAFVPAIPKAIEDEKNGVTADEDRQKTSFLPMFPIMPLLIWGGVSLVPKTAQFWTLRIVLYLHIILFFYSIIILIKGIIELNRIQKEREKANQ